jgi:zinc transport system substrate-binding protein
MYLRLVLSSVLMFALLTGTAAAQPQVIASIKPLQLIAASVMDGIATPELIVPANQSPHHFTLRPSDVARIAQADVALWVGGNMEIYLQGLFAQAGAQTQVLEFAAVPAVVLLEPGGGNLQAHGGHDHRYDPHLWLDTNNALLLAHAIGQTLKSMDPDNAAVYDSNLARFEADIQQLNRRIATQMATLAGQRYAVFHNSMQYFERQFGMQHEFVLVPDHEIQPGVRHLLRLRAQLVERQPVCLLDDVNSNDATVQTVFQDYPVRRVRVDVLGDTVMNVQRDSYIQLIDKLAASLQSCLSPQ